MRELAHKGKSAPRLLSIAQQLGTPPAIDSYLRSVWKWIPDPQEAEFIREPALQMESWAHTGHFFGDCDDAATLAAAMLAALDWPCRFVAIRFADSREFSHVFLRCSLLNYAPGEEWDIDPTTSADRLPIVGYSEAMEVPV